MKKIATIILMFTLLVNCKEEKVEPTTPVVEKQKETNKLTFEIHYTSSAADKIQMLFALIELNDGKNAMFAIDDEFKTPNEKQVLKFSMFDDLVPYVVQLKLGLTPKKVVVDKIIVKYDEDEVYIDGQDVDKYFALNNNVTFDSTTRTLNVNQDNAKSAPHITLRRGYINKLFKLL